GPASSPSATCAREASSESPPPSARAPSASSSSTKCWPSSIHGVSAQREDTMRSPQSGIFALGTASHAYLEFDIAPGRKGRELVAVISSLREPRTTMGGVNLVAGFRPELWKSVLPDEAPAEVEGFNRDIVGADRFVMPATQHDAVLWLSGSAY